MNKLIINLLKIAYGKMPEEWKLSDSVEFRYSETMRDFYLFDVPNELKDDEKRKQIGVIGPNDFYFKWTGTEFSSLEDTPLADVYDLVNETVARGSMVNGRKTGIPLSAGNHQILFYNKKYVKKAPDTFEELKEMSKEIRKREGLEYSFIIPTSASYFMLPMLCGYGADLWRHEGVDPISKEALRKTIRLFREMIYEKKMLPIKWEQEDSMPYFMEGKAAFCIGGDWNIRMFAEALGNNLGMCAIPRLEQECLSCSNASYLFLSKELDEALYENARQLCLKVLGDEVQTHLLKDRYCMPVARDYKLDVDKFDELTVASYEIYKKSFVMPPLVEVKRMYHVLAELLEREILISKPVEELTEEYYEKLITPNPKYE